MLTLDQLYVALPMFALLFGAFLLISRDAKSSAIFAGFFTIIGMIVAGL